MKIDILSAVQIIGRNSSFWQYKVYAGTCRDSLERRHQTTVGSRVMRTFCDHMVKFIRCVRNKLTVSSDVSLDVAVGHCGVLFVCFLWFFCTVIISVELVTIGGQH